MTIFRKILNELMSIDKATIVKMESIEDIQECLDESKDLGKHASYDVRRSILFNADWKISWKALNEDGKLIGYYLLKENNITDYDLEPTLEDLSSYEDKKGIEGVSLWVSPKYRNTGIGRKLRDKPLHMKYDYIWGQHYITLNNKQNWLNFGRRIVADYGNLFITLMDIK